MGSIWELRVSQAHSLANSPKLPGNQTRFFPCQDDLYGNIGGNEAKPGFTDPEDLSILKVLDITGTKSGCGYMVY
jgi:hypothetical protein